MQFLGFSRISLAVVAAVALAREAPAQEAQRISPRAAPTDYQAHAAAGSVTIAAEFDGHSVPTPEAVLKSDDFVAVEVGVYGPSGARLTLSTGDFSLRLNGKKVALPAQPFAAVYRSLKDQDWSPPASAESGKSSKTKIGGGGGGGQNDGDNLPPIIHIPIEVERRMQVRVQKAALPEGDRALPEAGLIFFPHKGKTDKLESIELIYEGPAGKATLALQP